MKVAPVRAVTHTLNKETGWVIVVVEMKVAPVRALTQPSVNGFPCVHGRVEMKVAPFRAFGLSFIDIPIVLRWTIFFVC